MMRRHSSFPTGSLPRRSTRSTLVRGWLLTLFAVAACPTLAAAQSPGEVVEYYHLDAVGSVRVVTNQAGAVVRRHDFKPFGEEINVTFPNPDRKLFTGQERDSETALDYFGARYYRANLGRFTTADPLGSTSGDHLYAYVGNRPLNFVDPTGRQRDPTLPVFRVTIVGCDAECQLRESFNRFVVEKTLAAVIPNEELRSRPWVLSWIVPLYPGPPLIGVGPAGSVAYNPKTHTFCAGVGAGASVGNNVALGPLLFGKSLTGTPWPRNANSILEGWSVSFGFNTPVPSPATGVGWQMDATSSGVAHGPTAGATGFSASVTYSACGKVH